MSLFKDKLRLHRLHRKLYDWLREKCAKDKGAKKLRIRLNGMESRTFSQHVMDLVDCMFPAAQDLPQHLFHVHALAYIGLKLWDAIALFSHYKITAEQLKDLKSSCRLYFNACKVLLDRPITPTIWIIDRPRCPCEGRKIEPGDRLWPWYGHHTGQRRQSSSGKEISCSHDTSCQQVQALFPPRVHASGVACTV